MLAFQRAKIVRETRETDRIQSATVIMDVLKVSVWEKRTICDSSFSISKLDGSWIMEVRKAISQNAPVLDLDESAIPAVRFDEAIPSSFRL
jgi:hypothetical protein